MNMVEHVLCSCSRAVMLVCVRWLNVFVYGKMALVLNPDVKDKYVWPIYCLANRLHGSGHQAVAAAGFDTAPPNSEYPLFATVPRLQAERALINSLASDPVLYNLEAKTISQHLGAGQRELVTLAQFIQHVSVSLFVLVCLVDWHFH